MTDRACVFCDVIGRRQPAEIVDEDSATLSFLDIHPLAIGHVLVVPKAHVASLPDADDDIATALILKVRAMAAVLPRALGAHGTFVLQNNQISQSVPHLHFHVTPRSRGDRLFSDNLVWKRLRYREGQLAETAARIRAALAVD